MRKLLNGVSQMRLTTFSPDPIKTIPFWNAGRGGVGAVLDSLPVQHGRVDRLPEGFSALVVTSDLQGREDQAGSPGQLLGSFLPTILRETIHSELEIQENSRIGALLAGDFYTHPTLEKRGGTGDVQNVWAAFAAAFDQVIGVPGNHDLFEGKPSPTLLPNGSNFLDGSTAKMGDLVFAGLGGIIGNSGKPHRRTLETYLETLEHVLKKKPDILLMHEGPGGEDETQPGLPGLQKFLVTREISLVIRGHSHWPHPLAEIAGKLQILNVDARVLILTE